MRIWHRLHKKLDFPANQLIPFKQTANRQLLKKDFGQDSRLCAVGVICGKRPKTQQHMAQLSMCLV
jgi:hypothetical protein